MITLLRLVYSTMLTLALPLIFLRFYWRSVKAPAYRQRLWQRIGLFKLKQPFTKSIWLHAVSLGEVNAAAPIIREILQQYPHIKLVVTTTTPTGSAQVMRLFADKVFHVYLPFDIPWTLNNFFKRIKPQLAIIMETEIWPNVICQLRQNNIPLIMANARLSPNSFAGYQRFNFIFAPLLNKINFILAQSAIDTERFSKLGVASNAIITAGNIKFEINPQPSLLQQGEKVRQQLGAWRKVWIAASTHNGEEQQILAAHQLIRKEIEDAVLIIVPRHPERFNQVFNEIKLADFVVARRSANDFNDKTAVLLGDSMGEMDMYYAASNVAFVGGSLVAVGGHNVLEPAALGLPVLSGPELFNFKEISEKMLQQQSLIIVADAKQLKNEVVKLLQQPEAAAAFGERAKAVVMANSGAKAKTMEVIANLLQH